MQPRRRGELSKPRQATAFHTAPLQLCGRIVAPNRMVQVSRAMCSRITFPIVCANAERDERIGFRSRIHPLVRKQILLNTWSPQPWRHSPLFIVLIALLLAIIVLTLGQPTRSPTARSLSVLAGMGRIAAPSRDWKWLQLAGPSAHRPERVGFLLSPTFSREYSAWSLYPRGSLGILAFNSVFSADMSYAAGCLEYMDSRGSRHRLTWPSLPSIGQLA
jgi:hypothetical protein